LAPDETNGTGAPLKGAVVDENGRYEFEDVVPGEYHVRFFADNYEFGAEYVSITAIEEGENLAESVSISALELNDTGCTTSDIGRKIFDSAVATRRLKNALSDQILSNQSLGAKQLKSAKYSAFDRALMRIKTRSDSSARNATLASSSYPLIVRSKCPAANSCSKTSLASKLRRVRSNLTALLRASGDVQKKALVMNPGKSSESANTRALKKVKKLYERAMKLASKLPSSNQNCPET
jgi:hypothetical protein